MNSKAPPKKRPGQYQSFPGLVGGSQSLEKLKRLRLPPMSQRSFLDVGCNEGYFCGYAQFMGANRVVGIDMREVFVERARQRFPQCEFLLQNWDTLPSEKFDVILLASALHYADDQPALLDRLVNCLTPRGTLVLELGIAAGEGDDWISVKRGIDTRNFATWQKLRSILLPYAWKYIGPSVSQSGDPVDRHVIHISQRSPIAYLFMQPGGSGKSFIASSLFAKGKTPIVRGDRLVQQLIRGQASASDRLKEFFAGHANERNMGVPVTQMFAADLAEDYIDCWLSEVGDGDFAFDGMIPQRHHESVRRILKERGYLPVELHWDRVGAQPASLDEAAAFAARYETWLANGQPPSKSGTQQGSSRAGGSAKATPLSISGVIGNLQKKLAINRALAWLRKQRLRNALRVGRTIGYVESIAKNNKLLIITGWAAGANGAVPPVLVVRLGGEEFVRTKFRTVTRSDVCKKLGTPNVKYGFEVDCLLQADVNISDVAKSIELRGGPSTADLGPAFTMSKTLKLRDSAPSRVLE